MVERAAIPILESSTGRGEIHRLCLRARTEPEPLRAGAGQSPAAGKLEDVTLPPPIQPRVDLLPLDAEEWDWKRFERFCVAFVRALPDVRHAYLYGGPGEDQAGIDVVSELVDGRTRAYQCRKRKAFGPRAVEKTIADAEFEADEYVIAVTRKVNRQVRDLVRKQPDWELLDKEDICQALRADIDRERARNIVEDAFDVAWRRAFLGPSGPLVFLEPERYFAPFGDEQALFRHTWQLVGRGDVLDTLVDSVSASEARVVVLPGRGGIGKTRVLRALSERLADRRVLFVSDSAVLTPEDVESLPFAEGIVVVDDAHRRDDLAALFAEVIRRSEPVILVLATRPQRIDVLQGDLARSGFSPERVRVLDPLGDLGEEDIEALAREALGPDYAARAEALAQATADCPLVTVVGGQLLAQRTVAPELLERQADFRAAVLDRWRDEIIGRLSERVDPETAALVLRQVAALAPVSVEDEPTLAAMASEAQVGVPQLRSVMGEVEAAGLLLARGRLRRIVPDVLADHILHRACLDASGRATGYAEELVQRYASVSLTSLLRSLAELDWRIGQTAGASTLLDQVWSDLHRVFIDADAAGRVRLLELVRPAAIFQPGRVIDLVERALVQPAAPAQVAGPFGFDVSDDDVRRALPDLLRGAGLHSQHALRVLALLWELGRGQPGELHADPSHPIRVAQELGGYEQTQIHNEALIDFVEQLVEFRDEVDAHHWSPLSLLEALLQREGTRLRSAGFGFQIGSYQVLAEPTAAVRARALAVLESQARDGNPRNRRLAAGLLGDALTQPRGIDGQRVSREHFDQWLPQQLGLLRRLERLIHEGDPLVRMQLRREVRWHARHAAWPEAKELAQAVVSAPAGLDERLLEAIAYPWDHSLDVEDMQAHVLELAGELAEFPEDDDALAERLNAAIVSLMAAGQSNVEPRSLLAFLGDHSPSRGAGLVRWMLANPERPLADGLHTLLIGLRRATPEELTAALRLLEDGNVAARRQLAAYLAGGSWFDDATSQELDLLRRLLRDEDILVRANALLAVLRFGRVDRAQAIELALAADLGAHAQLADYFSQTLRDEHAELSEEQMTRALEKLAPIEALDWSAGQLLVRLGEDAPARIVEFLVERARRGREPDFEPVPHDGIQGDLLSGADEGGYLRLLRRVRQATHDTDDAVVRHHLGSVFWQLDRDVDMCLLVLHEWLSTDTDDQVAAAAALLWQMPFGRSRGGEEREDAWVALLRRPWFVVDLVQRAVEHGGRVQERVDEVLRAVLSAGTYGRSMGGIDPRWRRTHDDASAVARMLPQGTPAQQFFASLEAYAKRQLEDDELEDEEYGEELR